jgi:uncharacterized protein YaiI (UPF0178 family)
LIALFKETVARTLEYYVESRQIVSDAAFNRLGLADAAIATLCRRSLLVLTDDLPLYHDLTMRGFDAINFNHIRTFV